MAGIDRELIPEIKFTYLIKSALVSAEMKACCTVMTVVLRFYVYR